MNYWLFLVSCQFPLKPHVDGCWQAILFEEYLLFCKRILSNSYRNYNLRLIFCFNRRSDKLFFYKKGIPVNITHVSHNIYALTTYFMLKPYCFHNVLNISIDTCSVTLHIISRRSLMPYFEKFRSLLWWRMRSTNQQWMYCSQ